MDRLAVTAGIRVTAEGQQTYRTEVVEEPQRVDLQLDGFRMRAMQIPVELGSVRHCWHQRFGHAQGISSINKLERQGMCKPARVTCVLPRCVAYRGEIHELQMIITSNTIHVKEVGQGPLPELYFQPSCRNSFMQVERTPFLREILFTQGDDSANEQSRYI